MVLTPPHHAREPPNLLVNIKGETLVELYDDAYYFWHPGTETFMSEGPDHRIIGTPTAAHYWEVRQGCTKGSPSDYYMFWGQELYGKRKRVLDTFDQEPLGSYVGTHKKHDGGNQKLILKSNGDKEGQVRCFPPFLHHHPSWSSILSLHSHH